MANPIMSLLANNKPTVDMSLAKKAFEIAPKLPEVPKKKPLDIKPPEMFDEVKNDILINNILEGKYLKNQTDRITGENANYLNLIASKETPGYSNPYTAVNKDTGAYGKYQFIPKYATPYLSKIGKNWGDFMSNPKVQDTVAQMKLEDLTKDLSNRGIELTPRNIYLGWQQGAQGLQNLLQGKIPSYKALDYNLPKGIDRTPSEFLRYWDSMFQ